MTQPINSEIVIPGQREAGWRADLDEVIGVFDPRQPRDPKPAPTIFRLDPSDLDVGIPPDYHGADLDERVRPMLQGNRKGLFLYGPPGTGKTRIAWAMLRASRAKRHEADLAGVPMEYVSRYDHEAKVYRWAEPVGLASWKADIIANLEREDRVKIIAECADIRRQRHQRDWLDDIAKWTGWLIVDDIGFAPPDNWTIEALYHLANVRLAHYRPTLWTSNLDPDQLAKTYGSAIASRLAGGKLANLSGDDRRVEA